MAGRWPQSEGELISAQERLASLSLEAPKWALPGEGSAGVVFGGCFIAYARGEAGPGSAGDHAWAAAVLWGQGGLVEEAVVAGTVPAAYRPGFLALREGPLLEAAVRALPRLPDVLLVDATGRDHPRRAGLALQLGAQLGVPTVGVTHRPFLARGAQPAKRRGEASPLFIGEEMVGYWVCTRGGARPVVAHAAWRTEAAAAAAVVLACSGEKARTPAPLREARRAARAARANCGHLSARRSSSASVVRASGSSTARPGSWRYGPGQHS
jgi:deoxyribonuclease V